MTSTVKELVLAGWVDGGTLVYNHRSRIYGTVRCLSVCLSQYGLTAAKPLLQVCRCGPGGQKISIDCCSSNVRRANAGSATMPAYIRS